MVERWRVSMSSNMISDRRRPSRALSSSRSLSCPVSPPTSAAISSGRIDVSCRRMPCIALLLPPAAVEEEEEEDVGPLPFSCQRGAVLRSGVRNALPLPLPGLRIRRDDEDVEEEEASPKAGFMVPGV